MNNLKKITLIFSITIFEYGRFHEIKKDNNGDDDDEAKEVIVIKDIRVSPYALKRKHLVELLIIKEKVKDTNKINEKHILQKNI